MVRQRRLIRVLIIPADQEPCRVTHVEYSAAALSDAIGGGLLADIYYGRPGSCGEGGRFCFYADDDRVTKKLPVNSRAEALAARLGCIGELRGVPLIGTVLVTGATCTNDDTDISDAVLATAHRTGLLPA